MAGFVCPYCNSIMAIDTNTHREHSPCFESSDGYSWKNGISTSFESTVKLDFYKCPNCQAYTVFAKGVGRAVRGIDTIIQPQSHAIQ